MCFWLFTAWLKQSWKRAGGSVGGQSWVDRWTNALVQMIMSIVDYRISKKYRNRVRERERATSSFNQAFRFTATARIFQLWGPTHNSFILQPSSHSSVTSVPFTEILDYMYTSFYYHLNPPSIYLSKSARNPPDTRRRDRSVDWLRAVHIVIITVQLLTQQRKMYKNVSIQNTFTVSHSLQFRSWDFHCGGQGGVISTCRSGPTPQTLQPHETQLDHRRTVKFQNFLQFSLTCVLKKNE